MVGGEHILGEKAGNKRNICRISILFQKKLKRKKNNRQQMLRISTRKTELEGLMTRG